MLINEAIVKVSKSVRLIKGNGEKPEIMDSNKALEIATEMGLDLICKSESADMPVVIIEDYGKYMYELGKKEKELKKKQKQNVQDLKEIQINDTTAENDLKVKAKNIDRILKGRDKVKISIRYKGRAIRLISGGETKIRSLLNMLTMEYREDTPVKTEGSTVSIIIAPVK